MDIRAQQALLRNWYHPNTMQNGDNLLNGTLRRTCILFSGSKWKAEFSSTRHCPRASNHCPRKRYMTSFATLFLVHSFTTINLFPIVTSKHINCYGASMSLKKASDFLKPSFRRYLQKIPVQKPMQPLNHQSSLSNYVCQTVHKKHPRNQCCRCTVTLSVFFIDLLIKPRKNSKPRPHHSTFQPLQRMVSERNVTTSSGMCD